MTKAERRVLIGGCLVAIVVSFVVNHIDIGSVNSRVTKIESPCLRYGPKSEACKRAFEQAVLTITHAQACAILRKAGLEIVNCRGARLKQEDGRHKERDASAEKRGDAEQTPSTGHQPPSPPSHGGHPGQGHAPSNPVTPPEAGVKHESPPNSPPGQSYPPPGNSGNAPGHTKGPLAPVVEQVLPPVAAPTVDKACEKAAAVAPVC